MEKTRRDFLKLAGSLCFTGYIGLSPFKLFGKPELSEVEARFYEKMPGGKVRCLLCPNFCVRASGETGQCRLRENVNGTYFTRVYGNPCVIAIDPVEKCPLFHYQLPNPAFSIATAGCNLFCHYCQNWAFSQKGPAETKNYSLTPAQVIDKALEYKSGAICFFYQAENLKKVFFLTMIQRCLVSKVSKKTANQKTRNALLLLTAKIRKSSSKCKKFR